MPSGRLGRAPDRSRVVAKERRSKTAVAPAPNKMHCQVAKIGLATYNMSRQRALGGHLFGSVISWAVQKPTPTPMGTEAIMRAVGRMRLTMASARVTNCARNPAPDV